MALPVLDIAQVRAWEQASWAAGVASRDVIRRVGAGLASVIRDRVGAQGRLLFLIGAGNNGADARAAMETLRAMGASWSDRIDAVEFQDPSVGLSHLRESLDRGPAWVVDGLFGIGLNRKLEAPWIEIITTVNKANLRVLAVDVPSGFNADTGGHWGAAVRAEVTLTVGVPKVGFLAPDAAPWVGRVDVIEGTGLLDVPAGGDLRWTVPGEFAGFPPRRRADVHKGQQGHVLMLAGSPGYHGAAVLAARGVLRARPGLLTLETHPETYLPISCQLAQAMVRVWDGVATRTLEDFSAVLAGPGLESESVRQVLDRRVVHAWRESPCPWVVDAGALEWLPVGPRRSGATRVITPHPGEAASILDVRTAEVQARRVDSLRKLSATMGGCLVVLKGYLTLVGGATGPIYVNGSGNPGLAQGGSGDVLAGLITGILAQPGFREDPVAAVRYAVWRHGAAADRLEQVRHNWTVEDLVGEV